MQMQLDTNNPFKIKDLLERGIPRACYCRTDENLEVEPKNVNMCISLGLKNGYNSRIVSLFVKIFGKNRVLEAIKNAKNYSPRFYNNVTKMINEVN